METPIKAYSYIRFSTKEQKRGTSYQRQYADTVKFCEEHDPKLTLDKRYSFSDLGLSAYHGIHKTKGTLGVFLKLVTDGKIPKGSILIVENLDRLSRENVDVALDQFRDIIRADITIITLQDGVKYSKESMRKNWAQFITAITYMANAYGGSKDKSDRLKRTWEIKRSKINKEKLTNRVPLWLERTKDGREFEPKPKVRYTMELIFRMKLSGMGVERIARILNESDDPNIWVPPYNSKRITQGWRGSYLQKIIHNKEVIGELTTCVKVDGKRVPVDKISNYYGSAIDKELFYQVQSHIKLNAKNNGNSGGKTGKAKNLFKNIVKCGYCGKPMHYIDKGTPPKGGIYLHCDSSRRKIKDENCIAKMVRYDEFENLFFEKFDIESEEILARLMPNKEEEQARKNQIKDLIEINITKIEESEAKIINWAERVASHKVTEENKLTYEKLMTLERVKVKKLTVWNKELSDERDLLKSQWEELRRSFSQVNSLREFLNSLSTEQEIIDTRHRLNLEIMKVFEWIKIYPLQEEYQEYKEVEPGIVQIMNSKFIDKITYKLREISLHKGLKSHGIIPLNTHVDIGNESLKALIDGQK